MQKQVSNNMLVNKIKNLIPSLRLKSPENAVSYVNAFKKERKYALRKVTKFFKLPLGGDINTLKKFYPSFEDINRRKWS